MTGEDKIDAAAIVEYFAPLKKWLDEQNTAADDEEDIDARCAERENLFERA